MATDADFLEQYAAAADVQDLDNYAMPMADSMASKASLYYKIKRCMVCDVSRGNAFVFPFPFPSGDGSVMLAGNVIHPEKSFPDSTKLKVLVVDHLVEISEHEKVTVALWVVDANRTWYRLNKPYSSLYAAVEADFTQKINSFVSNEMNQSLVESGRILNGSNGRVGISNLCRAIPGSEPFFLEGLGIIDSSTASSLKVNIRVNITQCELHIVKTHGNEVSRDFRVRSGDDGTWYRLVSSAPSADNSASLGSVSSDSLADNSRNQYLKSVYSNLFMQQFKVLGDSFFTVTDFFLTSLSNGQSVSWETLGSSAFPRGAELTGLVVPNHPSEKYPPVRIRVEVESAFVEVDQHKKHTVAHLFVKSSVENVWYRLQQPNTLYEHFPSSMTEYLSRYDWPSDPEEEWRRICHCKVVDKFGKLARATEITEKSSSQPFLVLGQLVPPVESTVEMPLHIRLYPFRYSIDFGCSIDDENAGLWFQMKGGGWYKALLPADAEYQAIADLDHQCVSNAIRFYDALLRLDESVCIYDYARGKYYTEFSLDEVWEKSRGYFDASSIRQVPEFILNNFDHVLDLKRSKALRKSLFQGRSIRAVGGGGKLANPSESPLAMLNGSSNPLAGYSVSTTESEASVPETLLSVAAIGSKGVQKEVDSIDEKKLSEFEGMEIEADDIFFEKKAKVARPIKPQSPNQNAGATKPVKIKDKAESNKSMKSKKNALVLTSVSVSDGNDRAAPRDPRDPLDPPVTSNSTKRKSTEVSNHVVANPPSAQSPFSASKSKPIGKKLRVSDSHLPVIDRIDYVSRRSSDNDDLSLPRDHSVPAAVFEMNSGISPRAVQSTLPSSGGISLQASSSCPSAGSFMKATADQAPTVGREQVNELFRKKNRYGPGPMETDLYDQNMWQLQQAKLRRAEEEQVAMKHYLSRGYGSQDHPPIAFGRTAHSFNSLEGDRVPIAPLRAWSTFEGTRELASHRQDVQWIPERSSRWAAVSRASSSSSSDRIGTAGELYVSVDSSEMDIAEGQTSYNRPSGNSYYGSADDRAILIPHAARSSTVDTGVHKKAARSASSGFTCCHCASKKKVAGCPNPLHTDGMLCESIAASKATAASVQADRSQSVEIEASVASANSSSCPEEGRGSRFTQQTQAASLVTLSESTPKSPHSISSRTDFAVHQPLSLVSHYNSSFASLLPPTRARAGMFIQSQGMSREAEGSEGERYLCRFCKSLQKSPTCMFARHHDGRYFGKHILVGDVDPLAHGLCPHCRGTRKREACPFVQHVHNSPIFTMESVAKNGSAAAKVAPWPLTSAAKRHAASTFVYEGCEEDALLFQVAAFSAGGGVGEAAPSKASEPDGSDLGVEDDAEVGKLSKKVVGDEKKERQRYILSKWSSAKLVSVVATAGSDAARTESKKPLDKPSLQPQSLQIIPVGRRERDPKILLQRKTMQSLGVYAEQAIQPAQPASVSNAPLRSVIKQGSAEKKKCVRWADMEESAAVQFRVVREYDPSHTIVEPLLEL